MRDRLLRWQYHDLLGCAHKNRVRSTERHGHVHDVADLESGRSDDCRQDAVERGVLEIVLATQDREWLIALEHVDDLVASHDVHFMHHHRVGRGFHARVSVPIAPDPAASGSSRRFRCTNRRPRR